MKPLFLVGYMAAGKTTLGRRAAQLLNVEFIDLDAYIESRYRKRISDLFAERGEEGFRDIERRMLHEVAEFDNVLVATGGGTPCFFDNMEYMRHRGVTVYLAASVQTLCRRLSHAKVKRPLVAGIVFPLRYVPPVTLWTNVCYRPSFLTVVLGAQPLHSIYKQSYQP